MGGLAIIGAAVFLVPTMGVQGLAIGVVAGSLGHLLIQVPALLPRNPRYFASFGTDHPDVRGVLRLVGPRMAGVLVGLGLSVALLSPRRRTLPRAPSARTVRCRARGASSSGAGPRAGSVMAWRSTR